MPKILIIEDDPAISRALTVALKEEQYDVLVAADGERGKDLALKERLDLILLDVVLPKMDGYDVCRELRAAGITYPILMLTSKKTETDKVVGLELGADDYITKPFSIRELLARIKAHLRRSREQKVQSESISFGDIVVDFKKMEAKKGGKEVKLSVRELEVLKFFIEHEGEVISRDTLLDKVWGYEQYPTTRTIDNYILSLRKKIEDDIKTPRHLLTVHTAGYKFIR